MLLDTNHEDLRHWLCVSMKITVIAVSVVL